MGVKPVTITSCWAVSIANLDHLTQDKVTALVERSHGRDTGAALRTSEIFERLQPLAKYLRYGEGKFSTSVVSEVTQLLLHVPAVWDKVEAKPLECQACAAEVLADLAHWLSQQADLPELEEAASRDVKELLVSFLSYAPSQQQDKPEEYTRTGCGLLLRAITRSPQFSGHQALPMLPADALLVLDWLHSHMLQPSLMVEGFDAETGSPIVKSIGNDGSPISTQDAAKMQRAILLLHFLDDDKVLLLVYHIVCTAVTPGCMELAPAAVDVLVHVVSWACSIVRGALAYLLEGQGDQWLGSVTSASRRGSQASYSASSAAPTTPPALSREGLLRVPSGKATRAAAKLASGVVQRLLQAADSMDEASITQVQRQVASVVEVLLDMVEACVSAASKMAAGEPAADKVLEVAGNILLDAEPLVLAYLDAGYNATALTARLRGLLLACARTADNLDVAAFKVFAATVNTAQPFGVRHNSVTGPTGSAGSRLQGRSSSAGSLALPAANGSIPGVGGLSVGASSVGAAGGCSWLATTDHPLQKWQWNLLESLLQDAPSAAQGEGWGPHWICRAVSEVLCQSMGACWKGSRQEAVQSLLLLPDTTSTLAEQQVVALAMARLFVLLEADQDLGRLMVPILAAPLTSSNSPSPPVSACIIWALVHMAASSAQGNTSTMWSFHQITELLVKLYREPLTGVGRDLMYSKPDVGLACPGALAMALARLAACTRNGNHQMRVQLRTALLQLFSDLGLGLTWSNQGGLQDLGSLLPAIGASCDGLESRMASAMRSGSNRLSLQQIQAVQKQDGNLIKLFRTLWLYCGMFRLADRDAPAEWRNAAGRVAVATPILLVTEGPQRVQGQNQRLKAELSNRLAKAGSVAEPAKLTSRLLSVCGLQQTSLGASTEPAKTAYLLAIATAEMCRVSMGPLPEAGESAPVAVMQAYLETAPPDSTDEGWMVKIADVTFNRYMQRLLSLQLLQRQGSSVPGSDSQEFLHAQACAVGLAATLTTCLTSSRPAQGGQQPVCIQVADAHLTQLMAKYPSLYWSPSALEALLEAVDTQNSLTGPAWKHLQSWIEHAARKAPTRTESLLHLFMGASPQAVSPESHRSALRHAVALLAACQEARKHAAVGIGSRSDEQGAMMALARKTYYSGLVSGLADAQGSQAHCIQISTQLRDVLEQSSAPLNLVTEYYLRAAALLAYSDADQMAPADTHQLLVLLASAPLKRFTPEMMGIASFAWNWVITAAPEHLPALFTEIASAWTWSVDKQMGLFSDETETSPELVEGVDSHHRWLQFLAEMWSSLLGRIDDAKHTARQVLQRMLQHSLRTPECLSSHPASISARFRLLALTLRLAQRLSSSDLGSQSTIVALLHDRVIQVGLLWFQESPAWYWCSDESAAHEQYSAVKDFVDLLTGGGQGPTVTVPMNLFPVTNAVSRQLADQLTNMSFSSGHSNEGVALSAPSTSPLASAAAAAAADSLPHPVWGGPPSQLPRIESCVQLLSFLCKCEVERLKVWADPQQYADSAAGGPSASLTSSEWRNYTHTAWSLSPKLAVALLQRFPSCAAARTQLEALICSHATKCAIQEIPEAAVLMASSKTAQSGSAPLAALCCWAPADAAKALQLLSGPTGNIPAVKAYAIRCLQNSDAEEVTFFLPQLVQALRNDNDGALKLFLKTFAHRHAIFAHHLIWSLQSEEKPPTSAFNPEVKRSGWQPPKDYGLWEVSGRLRSVVEGELSITDRTFWFAERDYFNDICEISGVLKPYGKDERRARTQMELEKVKLECQELYLPTNPHSRVLGHIPSSGTPMPSAAKVPILVAFEVEDSSIETRKAAKRKQQQQQQQQSGGPPPETPVSVRRTQALIFKVGDDVRQDVLALQVIAILKDTFQDIGLDLYLHPYGVLPTGYEKGIIEVVPNTKSRSAVGEITEGGLYEYFINTYGSPGTPTFEAARRNFIISEAGYAIASFLLQCKDRHNGNILIDNEGHLVHIDFGFILEISPGGNMGFESAAFKLSHEMTQLLDPGGTRSSANFKLFMDLCIRGFLAARSMAEPIIASVALMADSGLPCFSRGQPVHHLRKRFHLDKSDKQAAAIMRDLINDAYQKWTTGFYDYIQYLQNAIPM